MPTPTTHYDPFTVSTDDVRTLLEAAPWRDPIEGGPARVALALLLDGIGWERPSVHLFTPNDNRGVVSDRKSFLTDPHTVQVRAFVIYADRTARMAGCFVSPCFGGSW